MPASASTRRSRSNEQREWPQVNVRGASCTAYRTATDRVGKTRCPRSYGLYSYGLYSYGLCRAGKTWCPRSYGLYSYGLCRAGKTRCPRSYGLYSYGLCRASKMRCPRRMAMPASASRRSSYSGPRESFTCGARDTTSYLGARNLWVRRIYRRAAFACALHLYSHGNCRRSSPGGPRTSRAC